MFHRHLSVWQRGECMMEQVTWTYSPRTLDLGPTPPTRDVWVLITGDLLKLVHLRTYPQQYLVGGMHAPGMLSCCTYVKQQPETFSHPHGNLSTG